MSSEKKPRQVVTVYHDYYGCETGCCGHTIDLNGARIGWSFCHPDESLTEDQAREWARKILEEELGKDHCYDLDWDNCKVTCEECPDR